MGMRWGLGTGRLSGVSRSPDNRHGTLIFQVASPIVGAPRGGVHRLMKTTLVALALLLAGCGSTVSAAPGPTDRQLAVRSVLVLDDFPAGWNAAPRPKPAFTCAATAAARGSGSAAAESRVFDTRAKNTEAAGTVYVFRGEAGAPWRHSPRRRGA